MALPQITSNVIDVAEKLNYNTDDRLASIVKINSNILKSVSNIEKTFNGYIKWKKLQADLADDPNQKQKNKGFSEIKPMSLFGLRLVSGKQTLLGLAGLIAELTGLDDWLKTLDLPRIFKNIRGAFQGLNDFSVKISESISRFKLPELPKIRIVDSDGKNLVDEAGKVIENLSEKFKIRLPELPKFSFTDEAGKVIEKLPTIDMQPIRSAIAGVMLQFELFSNDLQEVVKSFPKIQIDMPEMPEKSGIFSGIKTFFVGTEEGGGIIGKIADFFSGFEIPEKLTKYLLTPLKFLIGPLITFLDFVFGAFDGWKEAAENPKATFGDKIWGALQGGVEGIIKGILGAIELVVGSLLPWILEQTGLNNAATFLKNIFNEEAGGGIAKYVDFSMWGEKLGEGLFNVFNVIIPDAIKSMTDTLKSGKQWLIDKLGLGNIFGENAEGIDFSKIFDKFKFDISLPELKFPDIGQIVKAYGVELARNIGSLIDNIFQKISDVLLKVAEKGRWLPFGLGDIFREGAATISDAGSVFKSNLVKVASSIDTSSSTAMPRMSATPPPPPPMPRRTASQQTQPSSLNVNNGGNVINNVTNQTTVAAMPMSDALAGFEI